MSPVHHNTQQRWERAPVLPAHACPDLELSDAAKAAVEFARVVVELDHYRVHFDVPASLQAALEATTEQLIQRLPPMADAQTKELATMIIEGGS